MKKAFLLLCTASSLLSSCDNKSTAPANETKDTATVVVTDEKKERVKPDSATMMKNWQEYMTPGTMHQMLASWDGNWIGESSMWMSPDAPPQVSALTVTHSMIHGGRYQIATHKGTMMDMPFEGTSTTGYDNAKKKFINTWIDNTGTGMMYSEGTWDEATKTITYTGKCVASDRGDGSEMAVKQVLKIIDDKHQEFTMYMIEDDGKETKTLEIKYTKK
ncbi:MAG: DUF1579 domain-containing protein [Bacteroidota bacterium]